MIEIGFATASRATTSTAKLISDNADYHATFTFDAEWNSVEKTARFQQGSTYQDVLLVDDACVVPRLKSETVLVGVYSADMATIPCCVYVASSIKDKLGSPASPTPTVYEQLLTALQSKADGILYEDNVLKLLSGETELSRTIISGGGGGTDGRGIVSVILTNTVGLVDTYTITYTDDTTSTFDVTNGAQGEQGEPGIQGEPGADGADGRGIVSTELTSTSGLVDTYTITYSDGTTSTFDVTNGADGEKGDKGDKGDTGDTGSQGIQGVKGDKGDPGTQGIQGVAGESGIPDVIEVADTVGEGWISMTIQPNVMYVFPTLNELEITLGTGTNGKVNEYMFSVTADSTLGLTLILDSGIVFKEEVAGTAGKFYECSIINNKGLSVEW